MTAGSVPAAVRVLFVSSLWPPEVLGGAELYADELAAGLREEGHEVAVVTRGVPGAAVIGSVTSWPYSLRDHAGQGRARWAGFHALDLHHPATGPVLRRAISTFSPDVVHSHSIQGLSAVALTVPSRAGIPHVHTLHDYWLLCQRTTLAQDSGDPCEERCRACRSVSTVRSVQLRRHGPDLFIAPSQAVEDEHRTFLPAARRVRVVVHPAGDPVAAAGRPPGAPLTFGLLSRLTASKGVTTLLDAFRSLPPARARLRVAGEGPLAGAVADAEGVELVGWVAGDAKDAFLRSIDCLVVPSVWKEPAGFVINEARAYGLPVVAAAIGGIPEYVPARSRPLLFRPGDPVDLARALRDHLDAPSAHLPDGTERWPSWPEHRAAVVACYEEAIRLRAADAAAPA